MAAAFARSVRLRPHKLLQQHTLQVLASSLEAGMGNAEQWEVLLRALQKHRHELALLVITREGYHGVTLGDISTTVLGGVACIQVCYQQRRTLPTPCILAVQTCVLALPPCSSSAQRAHMCATPPPPPTHTHRMPCGALRRPGAYGSAAAVPA